MFCPKCGSSNDDNSAFCSNCGAKFEGVPQAVPATEPQTSTQASTPPPEASQSDAPAVPPQTAVPQSNTGAVSAQTVVPAAAGQPQDPNSSKKGGKVKVIAIIVAIIAVVIIVAAVLLSTLFAQQEEEAVSGDEVVAGATVEPGENAQEGGAEMPTELTSIPNTLFGLSEGDGYQLVNLEDEPLQIANPDVTVVGPFAEGYALASWETSEYDEEWDTEHDKVTHLGLVDQTGNVTIELDPVIQKMGISGALESSYEGAYFSEGRMLINLDPDYSYGDGDSGIAVIDTQGNLLFILNRGSGALSGEPASKIYQNGILELQGGEVGDCIIDVNGKVLLTEKDAGGSFYPVGNGFYRLYGDDEKVYRYDKSVAFNASIANTGKITDASLADSDKQPSGGAYVLVDAIIENPYGGRNKELSGLYNVEKGKWIVPMTEEEFSFSNCCDGLIWIETSEKVELQSQIDVDAEDDSDDDVDEEEYTSESEASVEKSALVDSEGNVVFNASMVDTSYNVDDNFEVGYTHGGYWFLSNESSSVNCAIYIQDGKYQGIQLVNFDPISSYSVH